MKQPVDEIDNIIEKGVAEIYRGFYRLRISEQYQREYEEMGALLSMLMEDRDYLRKNKGVV